MGKMLYNYLRVTFDTAAHRRVNYRKTIQNSFSVTYNAVLGVDLLNSLLTG